MSVSSGVTIDVIPVSQLPHHIERLLNNSSDQPVSYGGRFYAAAGGRCFSCKQSEEGYEVLSSFIANDRSADYLTKDAVYRALFSGGTDMNLLSAAKNAGIPEKQDLFIIVFVQPYNSKIQLYSSISQLIPASEGDTLVQIGYVSAALVKRAEDGEEDDVGEFVKAVVSTAEAEIGVSLRAGISRICRSASGLRTAYHEAESALKVSEVFGISGSVFRYEDLLLERIIMHIPEERSRDERARIFRSGTEKLLNDEMIETVNVFFQNDLNMTTASKQLFIHRNTLSYRLDRIKRFTGFDLRRFQDAAVFRILMELENLANRNNEPNI